MEGGNYREIRIAIRDFDARGNQIGDELKKDVRITKEMLYNLKSGDLVILIRELTKCKFGQLKK